MEERHLDKNAAALHMFRASYEQLSAWGQEQVNHAISRVNGIDKPHIATLDNRENVFVASERMAQEIENLRLENYDLWDENTNLKEEVEELRDELQEAYSGRRAPKRQD